MNVATVLNSRTAGYAALALVGAVAAYIIVKRLGEAGDKALDEFNKGTAYDSSGTGLVGSAVAGLGNATNQASGGVLGAFGGWLGRTAHSLFGNELDTSADYYPASPKSPPYATRKTAIRSGVF